MAEGRAGYRGYIGSRLVQGERYPQRVQNLVIRDYAARSGLPLKMSAVEHAMPGCTMMLDGVLDELPRLEGIILFSAFMLPEKANDRARIYRRVLETGASLHAALESRHMATEQDFARSEEVLRLACWLRHAPDGGVYRKPGEERF